MASVMRALIGGIGRGGASPALGRGAAGDQEGAEQDGGEGARHGTTFTYVAGLQRSTLAPVAVALALAGLPVAGFAQGAALRVEGIGGRKVAVSAAEIAELPHVEVRVVQHGDAHVFAGALLADVLARAGAPLGPALRGRALALAVRVSARDGYVAALGRRRTRPCAGPR